MTTDTNKGMPQVLTWDKVLSAERQRMGNRSRTVDAPDLRTAFEKDYHRVIISASFRRLQDKTQVFPLDQSDFIRTRLTHSLEVSSLAKSLGQQSMSRLMRDGGPHAPTAAQAQEVADILLCAGLLHDIGNPPFGHYGETTIRAWFAKQLPTLQFEGVPLTKVLTPVMKADLLNYEGNAQALRLLSKLHYVVDEYGMNLTFAVLNTLVKYPIPSLQVDADSSNIAHHKMGYLYADEALFKRVAIGCGTGWYRVGNPKDVIEEDAEVPGAERQLRMQLDHAPFETCRHPLTYLLEAADDISYRTADIEDAYRKDKLTYEQITACLDRYRDADGYTADVRAAYGMLCDALDQNLTRATEKGLQKPEQYAIQNWLIRVQSTLVEDVTETFAEVIDEIMHGTFDRDLFEHRLAGLMLDVLGELAYTFVFRSRMIVSLEVAADAVIGGLLDKFVPACLQYDTDQAQSPVEARLMALVSDNYKHSYHVHAGREADPVMRLYLRLLLVTDYICGMTDSYARDLFHKLNGTY